MKQVCVITGGGSGMGFAAARWIGKEYFVVICGRNASKLQQAVTKLQKEGIEAEAYPCDVSDRKSVRGLADYAKKKGKVMAVIHAAGLSPHMGDAYKIMKVNALGTINVNEAFYDVLQENGCLIDVSSMSAYLIPKLLIPARVYKHSMDNPDKFMKKIMHVMNLFPRKVRDGVAYGISKNFVIWFAKKSAVLYGKKGVRVISVSPGNFETPMGDLEREEAEKLMKYCTIKRFGHVEEIASLLAYCISPSAGYLTGVDILCDGGLVSAKTMHE